MKTVIEMVREAGIRDCTCNGTLGCLERFASLVRAEEREACAKVAEQVGQHKNQHGIAAAIRARGNVATNDTSQERVDKIEKQRHDTPPQRTWVGLTDEDELDWDGGDLKSLIKAIEAKLKEKNT